MRRRGDRRPRGGGVLIGFLLWGIAAGGARAEPAPALLGRPLRSVEFVSSAPLDEAALRALVPVAIGEPLGAAALEELRRLLELREVFRSIDFALRAQDGGVALEVRLERKRVIGSVDIAGLDALSDKNARRVVRLDKGMIYEAEFAEAARERLRERLEKMGFVDAEVALESEAEDGVIHLKYVVAEGEPLVIASVLLAGDATPVDGRLLEEARDLEGERRTRESVRAMDRRLIEILRQAGYYEARVASTWERTGGPQGILRFTVERGPHFEIVFAGNREMDRDDLLDLIDLGERLIVTDGTWRELARRMRRRYEEAGHYRAEVGVAVEGDGEKRVRFAIDEGRKYFVDEMDFVGNRAVAPAALREHMVTAARRWFPWPRSGVLIDDVLKEDRKRLRFFYRRQGFESAKIEVAPPDLDEGRGRIRVTVRIEEGARTVVRSVDASEISAPLGDADELKLAAGMPFDPTLLKEDQDAIAARLLRAGHPAPKVEAEVTRRPAGAEIDAAVRWRVDPGPRQTIGRIIVQRNIDTRSRAVRRVLPFEEGDPLVVEKLLQGQVDLYELGLFRSVSIEPISPPDRSVRDVAVSVTERPAGVLELGGGYNTRDGVQANLDVGYRNIGGMARTLRLRLLASLDPSDFVPDQYLGSLTFVEPRLLGSRWRYTSTLIGERSTETVDNFSIERVGFLNGVDRPFGPSLNGGLETQVEQARVFDVEPDAVLIPEDDGSLRTVAVQPFVLYDSRDDKFAPTRGFLDSLRFRYGLPGLSTIHFSKLIGQHAQFIPLVDGLTFIYSLRSGWGRALDGGDFLPIRERFFLGGRTSVRGFGENSIGPRGANGGEIGGDFYVNTNLELQFPLLYGLGGAIFFDGGGLYLLQCDADCREQRDISRAALNFDNFRRSVGAGLRYHTPVGPIAVDYGIKLDRRGGESFGRLHFSIGTTF